MVEHKLTHADAENNSFWRSQSPSRRYWIREASLDLLLAKIGLIHNRQHQGWRRGKIQWPKKMWRGKTIICFCARHVSPALPSRGHHKPHVEMERGGKYVLYPSKWKREHHLDHIQVAKLLVYPHCRETSRLKTDPFSRKLQDCCVRSYRRVPASSFQCHHLQKKHHRLVDDDVYWSSCGQTVLVSTGKPCEGEFSRNKFKKKQT